MSLFWSLFIIILTLTCIGLLVWILMANRTSQQQKGESTGHVYDGIEELDNPLPAWWFYSFLFSIIFSIGYLIAYPGLGSYKGLLNWTSVGEWQASVDKGAKQQEGQLEKYRNLSLTDLANDPQATKMGSRIFANNCAVCHGGQAKGSFGFPDLTDNDWLYGSDADVIYKSILNGRTGAMPAWGSVLNAEQSMQVTKYVASLSKKEIKADNTGKQIFALYCAACHMADGSGSKPMGAPNLTDNIWLYGGQLNQIRHSIEQGRNGAMPAHESLLSDAKIRLVTAYVLSLQQQ